MDLHSSSIVSRGRKSEAFMPLTAALTAADVLEAFWEAAVAAIVVALVAVGIVAPT
jgi:hypothetical protein